MNAQREAVEHFRVTWFPDDAPEKVRSFTTEDSEANWRGALRALAAAVAEGATPVLEKREVSDWTIVRNSAGFWEETP